MRVAGVETFVVGNPPPRHGGRYFLFVQLTTDDGIVGVGEAYVATVGPHLVADMLVDVAEGGGFRVDAHRFDMLGRCADCR